MVDREMCMLYNLFKEAVQRLGNLALEYSKRCTEMTSTLNFLFSKIQAAASHFVLKSGSPGP